MNNRIMIDTKKKTLLKPLRYYIAGLRMRYPTKQGYLVIDK